MNRELLQQALDALKLHLTHHEHGCVYLNPVMYALEAALAQPEQASNEPPDYVEPPTSDYHNGWEEGFEAAKNLFKKESAPQNADPRLLLARKDNCTALAQPEPQVCCGDYAKCMKACTPRGRWLANQQMTRIEQEKGQFVGGIPEVSQQREWVGLTDDEIEKIVDLNTLDDGGFDIWCDGIAVAHIVCAKLKEKNT